MSYIVFDNINKKFGENHVLKNTNLSINQGDFVTFLGPSGCGKSTLLRCLAGLETISSGQIILDGKDITYQEPKDRNIGMVFQQYSLFPNMNVFENIAFGLKRQKLSKEVINDRVKDVINMVELNGKEQQFPSQLSGGQQQRVALARSIVTRPKVLLLDEPFSAIDAKLRHSLQSRVKEIHDELKITTIFVTHDQDEAMIMSDIIHLFHDGVIEQSGNPISLYTTPKTSFAASFIGNYNLVSSENFSILTGERTNSDIAIRPETFEITTTAQTVEENYYQFEGKVKEYTPRGNVLRYIVDVNGIPLKVDVLFRSFKLFENNQPVYINVEKKNCLQV